MMSLFLFRHREEQYIAVVVHCENYSHKLALLHEK